MKYCFLFPGQGAQYPGMGRDLYDYSDQVKRMFKIADDLVPFDIKKTLFESTQEELKATDKAQVAITLTNMAAAIVLREHNIVPVRLGGFSLGEYAALVAAEVLSPEDAITTVHMRGEIMEKNSRLNDSSGGQAGMAAIIGLDFDTVRDTLVKANLPDLYLAIHNSPFQTVVAGIAESLTQIEQIMYDAGAHRYVPLQVSGPFHTPLMAEARQQFDRFLRSITFQDPVRPIYSNVTAAPITSGDEARTLCVKQLGAPVCWVDEQVRMANDGCEGFLEVGPGNVLRGLWQTLARKNRDKFTMKCRAAGTLKDIKNLVEN